MSVNKAIVCEFSSVGDLEGGRWPGVYLRIHAFPAYGSDVMMKGSSAPLHSLW